MLNQTDELEELISGCIQNERGAQAKLYHLFYRKMMAMVRRYFPDQMHAEEILNNAFLKAFLNVGNYAFKGSFEGWLRKIVFHSIADYAKQHVRYKDQFLLVEKDEIIHKDHASNLYYDDLLNLVSQLPEATRVVFNLFVIDGMSHKEISQMLGISEGTTKWHVSVARKELKEKIEKLNLH